MADSTLNQKHKFSIEYKYRKTLISKKNIFKSSVKIRIKEIFFLFFKE